MGVVTNYLQEIIAEQLKLHQARSLVRPNRRLCRVSGKPEFSTSYDCPLSG